ncbi:hypothetical protein [Pseudomonas sp. PS01300]|uniref:hypothetical protein n=1 Tax=Pseudomonas sp. PS01300 TaxID=2991436 RepID=UPI00249A7C8B|nr:hypothetical protein [Pseudomonas sp. PS01300]
MSDRYGRAQPGEFLPGIIMPPEIHGLLRKRVTEIEVSDTAVNCLIAQARAESLVEALEILKAVDRLAVERLYVMIENMALARLAELGG